VPATGGTVSGHVVPAATVDDADVVVATQALAAGAETRTLVVRTAPASVALGVESWSLDALPPGGYALAVERRTIDSAGDESTRSGAPVDVTLAPGGSTTVDLVGP
jgi:hypothetical protein